MAGEDALQIRVTADFKEVESAFLNLSKNAKSLEGDIRKVAGNVSREFNKIEGTATLFGDASNVVKDKMDTLRSAMERLMAMGFQPANKYVQELKTKYDQLATSLVVVEKVTKTTSTVNTDAANALKKSNQQYTNFALVLQDLPYGFRGIQNNLPALMGGIAGMAGPFYLVGSAVIALFTAWDQGSFKAMEAIDRVAEAHKRKSDVLKKSAEAESDAVVEMAKMSALFEGVKNGSVSAEYALNQYNETLGKTFGEAKNLNEAEDAFMSKTGAYVKSIALRAMADEKYEQAKKAFREGREAAGKDQTNFLQKFAAGMDALDEVGIMGMDIASMTKWATSFSKNISETQKILVNDAVNLAASSFDLFIAEGNNFVKEANKLQSAFGIKGKGGKTTKTSAGKKDNSLEKAQDVQIQNYIDTLSERDKEIVKSELKLQDDIAALNKAGFTNYEGALTANRARVDKINQTYDNEEFKRKEKNRNEIIAFETKLRDDLSKIDDDNNKAFIKESERIANQQAKNVEVQLGVQEKLHKNNLNQRIEDTKIAMAKLAAMAMTALDPASLAIYLEMFDKLNAKLQGLDVDTLRVSEALRNMNDALRNLQTNTLVEFGTQLGNIFSGVETDASAFFNFLGDTLIQLGTQLILTSKLFLAFKALFSNPATAAFAIPVGIAAIAAGVMLKNMVSNKANAFANGGIVSGPTMGLVGEYPGAQSNPEVIAPLDKLKSIIGGSSGGGGTFVLRGQDLLLSVQKAQKFSKLKGQNINLV